MKTVSKNVLDVSCKNSEIERLMISYRIERNWGYLRGLLTVVAIGVITAIAVDLFLITPQRHAYHGVARAQQMLLHEQANEPSNVHGDH
jgi:hypothetical protein